MNKMELINELEAAQGSARVARGAIRALELMRRQGYSIDATMLTWWQSDLQKAERRMVALKLYQDTL